MLLVVLSSDRRRRKDQLSNKRLKILSKKLRMWLSASVMDFWGIYSFLARFLILTSFQKHHDSICHKHDLHPHIFMYLPFGKLI